MKQKKSLIKLKGMCKMFKTVVSKENAMKFLKELTDKSCVPGLLNKTPEIIYDCIFSGENNDLAVLITNDIKTNEGSGYDLIENIASDLDATYIDNKDFIGVCTHRSPKNLKITKENIYREIIHMLDTTCSDEYITFLFNEFKNKFDWSENKPA